MSCHSFSHSSEYSSSEEVLYHHPSYPWSNKQRLYHWVVIVGEGTEFPDKNSVIVLTHQVQCVDPP